MPIPSLYLTIPKGYVKAHLPTECFIGEEHGRTIGIAYAVCKDVVQVWNDCYDSPWDLFFPSSEYNRISHGRNRITIQRLLNILEEEAAAKAAAEAAEADVQTV